MIVGGFRKGNKIIVTKTITGVGGTLSVGTIRYINESRNMRGELTIPNELYGVEGWLLKYFLGHIKKVHEGPYLSNQGTPINV